jgi:hypothetical protein
MLYNTTHKFTKLIIPPSQEDIYNCPHYFSMSYDQIKNSNAPSFVMNILDQFPFDGRKNIIQVRPQDFRNGNKIVDGIQWHTDVSARMLNDKKLFVKRHNDWHLMLISFGAGCSTEFITTPMELIDNLEDHKNWSEALSKKLLEPFEIITASKNQLVEYTERDMHRADGIVQSTGLRLAIIAFDCDNGEGNVRILPSIKELDNLEKRK